MTSDLVILPPVTMTVLPLGTGARSRLPKSLFKATPVATPHSTGPRVAYSDAIEAAAQARCSIFSRSEDVCATGSAGLAAATSGSSSASFCAGVAWDRANEAIQRPEGVEMPERAAELCGQSASRWTCEGCSEHWDNSPELAHARARTRCRPRRAQTAAIQTYGYHLGRAWSTSQGCRRRVWDGSTGVIVEAVGRRELLGLHEISG